MVKELRICGVGYGGSKAACWKEKPVSAFARTAKLCAACHRRSGKRGNTQKLYYATLAAGMRPARVVFSYLQTQSRASAGSHGKQWELPTGYFYELWKQQGEKCAICAEAIEAFGGGPLRPSLDRLDETLGYTATNVQVTHSRCNMRKPRQRGAAKSPARLEAGARLMLEKWLNSRVDLRALAELCDEYSAKAKLQKRS